jgi:TPR repeat protein
MRNCAFFPLLLLYGCFLVFSGFPVLAYHQDEESAALRENLMPAQQGDAKAQVFVAYLYETGQGVKQDYAKAAEWYRKAAEKGNATAQTQIGNMYFQGRGVPQNYIYAYMWLELASRQGNVQAKASKALVKKKMSQTQIAEAKKMSWKWKPSK